MKNSRGLTSKLSPFALRFLNCLLVLTLILPWLVGVGQASTTIVVDSPGDVKKNDGQCTLREAIIAANSDKRSAVKSGECPAGNGTDDTIILPADIYILSRSDNGNEDAAATGDLDILDDLHIIGAGFGKTIIDASGITDRAFQILSGNVTIEGVTITKNGGVVAGDGGGIHNSGHLTLVESTLADNHTAARGGAIYNAGILTLKKSTLGDAEKDPDGQRIGQPGNTAADSGGALFNASTGSATLDNSTVSGNGFVDNVIVTNTGAGIFNEGVLILNNATIADNKAKDGGAGGVVNSTVGTVNYRNTIIARNLPNECTGEPLISQGYNLVGDVSTNSCDADPVGKNDIITDSPLLDGLKLNGGQTKTHALQTGSPAIDKGDVTGCFGSEGFFAFDQRGEPRPTDGDSNGSFQCDIGAFELGKSSLVLIRAFPNVDQFGTPVTTVHGLLDGAVSTTINVNFFSSCEPSSGNIFHIGTDIPTNAGGYFSADILGSDPGGDFVTAKATHPISGIPMQSNCVPFASRNDAWPFAEELFLSPAIVDDQYIDSLGQSRWFKFKVEPNSDLSITLSGLPNADSPLPADYDLTLYRDLEAAFLGIVSPDGLLVLGAQSAGSSFNGSSFNGSSFNGSSFNGSSFNGSSFNGSSFNGSSFNGGSTSGDAYIGSSFNGSSFNGSSFNGSSFNGSSFNAEFFGGDQYSQAFSDAQSRSLLAVSAIGGTAPENIFIRTWNSDEYYYLRIRGRNGAFSLEAPFRLEVRLDPGGCSGVDFDTLNNLPIGTNLPVANGGYETIILTDQTRGLNLFEIVDPVANKTLKDKLDDLAGMVNGVVVNVDDGDGGGPDDTGVQLAKGEADGNLDCPFAKNAVAEQIKQIIDAYQGAGNPLKYVVIVGVDNVIPFFRHPDNAELARESQFVPPVDDGTAAQAALRLDYILSDDDYIAKQHVEFANSNFPIIDPNLAVGRLVETPAEIATVIDAFLAVNGVVQPQTSLVTGYDFLEDATVEIEGHLRDGTGVEPDDLITPQSVNIVQDPDNPAIWHATDLSTALLESGRHDLVFLAGHFSSDSALAADYKTVMSASEVAESMSVDLDNAIIFSVGCHAGYNVADEDGVFVNGIPVTRQPDWAQAFASQGATLIAGTGYQYGETETKEYSERLYIEFSKKIAPGSPVSIGHALNQAKLAYIVQVPQIRGLHEKAILEAAIFGLPMLTVDLPGDLSSGSDGSIITGLTPVPDPNPDFELGLQFADIDVTSPLNEVTRELVDIDNPDGPRVPAVYLTGTDGGVVTYPMEPFLPLELRNVTVPDTVLRGVGFRSGSYKQEFSILPLTGAPTTEAIALHLSWQTDYFHPIQMWNTNYLGALIDGQQRVLFTPVQHVAGDIVNFNGTDIRMSDRREFGEMNFRLFYSDNVDDFSGHTPALSAPPSILRVSAIPSDNEVTFRVTAVGDPSAGMQSVWVTWTDTGVDCPRGGGTSCTWQSLDLTQRPSDSTLWEGILPLDGTINPDDIRYIVQATNYFGRIGLATNFGRFFTPGIDAIPEEKTQLTLEFPPGTEYPQNGASGVFLDEVDLSATLETIDGDPLEGQVVEFRLGPGLSAQGTTVLEGDDKARARVSLNLWSTPNPYKLVASFAGTDTYEPSYARGDFTIEPRGSTITYQQAELNITVFPGEDSGIVVRLEDEFGMALREQGVFIVLTNGDGDIVFTVAGITNLDGELSLGVVDLPPGTYTVIGYFNDLPSDELPDLTSDAYGSSFTPEAKLTIAQSPCETTAAADTYFIHPDDPPSIWPPNGELVDVDISLDDPTDQMTITIDSIEQDEPVGSIGPDGVIVSDGTPTATIQLRAERDGNGDGRVYIVTFTGSSPGGFSCTRTVKIPVVEHDQAGDPDAFDSGDRFDSTEEPKNDLPVADDDSNTTDEETFLVVGELDADNVLANDTDKNPHDVLSVTAVNGDANDMGSQITLPSGALLTLYAHGGYDYDPIGQFDHVAVGVSDIDTFTYQVGDGRGGVATATVTINITGVNDPPVANDDSATVDQGGTVTVLDSGEASVLANDSDPDIGDTLTVVLVEGPTRSSSFVLNPEDGTFSYAHDGSATTSDSFTYEVSDGNGGTAMATVNIAVNTLNQPPDAGDDTATVYEGGTVEVSVLANDTDPETENNLNLTVSPTPVSGPSNGSLILNEGGTFSYVHDGSETTSDSFVYEVCDDGVPVECSMATVTITVNPVNDAPVANDDAASIDTNVNAAVDIDVTANDTDVDGTIALTTVNITSGPANGQVSVDPVTGIVTYTPDEGFLGPEDTFTYTVNDDGDAALPSNEATVTVTVTANRPPVAYDDEFPFPDPNEPPLPQGEPVSPINVLADNGHGEDYDEDGDPLTVVSFTQGERGEVTANDDGTLKYTPNSNFRGDDSFTYTISDGRGGTATATVTVKLGG